MKASTPGSASHYGASNTIPIPQHWSAEQALAVWEFLDEIARCVWDRYELPIIALIRPELDFDDAPAQLDLFDHFEDPGHFWITADHLSEEKSPIFSTQIIFFLP